MSLLDSKKGGNGGTAPSHFKNNDSFSDASNLYTFLFSWKKSCSRVISQKWQSLT